MKAKNLVLIILGFAFMFSMLFYTFGGASKPPFYKAEIKTISPITNEDTDSQEKAFAVTFKVLSGQYAGQTLSTEHFESANVAYNMPIATGDTIIAVIEKQDGELITGIDEHYKSNKLMLLSMLIIIIIAVFTGINGLKAMIALFFTLIIIFGFMARYLLMGYSPIWLAIISSIAIAAVNLIFIAGKTKKALIAIIGTLAGVFLAGIFGSIATGMLHLTGYTGHESTYLQIMNAKIDLKGILISGIIIGALGAVMDVAISIASSLQEISIANPSYQKKELFQSGMNIGKDIIGSMVNTLILAYTGASLSLILLFSMQKEDFPLIKIMNMEFISSEIVRSLAGLFGMVLAIPITAFIASSLYAKAKSSISKIEEN